MQESREPLKAEGNLTYRQFIKLVQHLWAEGHPDIPIYPTQGGQQAKYPCIVYGLEVRKTHPVEPKPRFREAVVRDGDTDVFIHGQRFQNIVSFTVVDENADRAEVIIEIFEDFMLEFTPVFKRMGVSEFVYSRRLPDSEENRQGEDVARRSVAYMLTTEKIRYMEVEKINKFVIDARIYLANNVVTDIISISTTDAIELKVTDQDSGATPNN